MFIIDNRIFPPKIIPSHTVQTWLQQGGNTPFSLAWTPPFLWRILLRQIRQQCFKDCCYGKLLWFWFFCLYHIGNHLKKLSKLEVCFRDKVEMISLNIHIKHFRHIASPVSSFRWKTQVLLYKWSILSSEAR